MEKQKKNKPICCPVCGRKYYDTGMGAARLHIQRRHPESHLSPKLINASIPNDILGPTAAAANTHQEIDEPTEINVDHALETGPIDRRFSYSLSGGSPWKVLSDGLQRTIYHPGFPGIKPSVIETEWVQRFPGKAETISNVVVNELDTFVKRTQAIILVPTREAAQTTYKLVSASATASVITHLSVGGTNAREDIKRLRERPHVVVGTTGRLSDMIKRKVIDPNGIKFLCVDGIRHLLSATYEKEFAEFCERLPKDIQLVLLPTKTRYRTPHDFSKFFIREPLHFLVKEDPTLEPSVTLHNPEPVDVDSNQIGDTTDVVRLLESEDSVIDINDAPERLYREGHDRGRGFLPEAHLKSHTKFFHPTNPPQTTEGEQDAAGPSNDLPEAGHQQTIRSIVYFSVPSNASSPHSGERATWDSPRVPGTPAPPLAPEKYQDTSSDVGSDIWQQEFENSFEPSTIARGDVDAQSTISTSTPLSLKCRICNTPPTVGSRPTATMCGHIFCSGCITQHVMSTSKCPVCDNALLLYCLFKLDLPISS